jgi:hypothetical protein
MNLRCSTDRVVTYREYSRHVQCLQVAPMTRLEVAQVNPKCFVFDHERMHVHGCSNSSAAKQLWCATKQLLCATNMYTFWYTKAPLLFPTIILVSIEAISMCDEATLVPDDTVVHYYEKKDSCYKSGKRILGLLASRITTLMHDVARYCRPRSFNLIDPSMILYYYFLPLRIIRLMSNSLRPRNFITHLINY